MTNLEFTDMMQVYEYCKTTIFNRMVAETGDYDLADDISSELFSRLMEHRTWLLGISSDRQYKYIDDTAYKIKTEYGREERLWAGRELREEMYFRETDEDVYLDCVNKEYLKECFEGLKPHERIVMEKRYIENKTTQEITEELQLSEDTVFQRISRAKNKIKNRMPGMRL